MTSYARPIEPAPMLEMNTTPLIDVMLVLIIMLIMTIPVQTHAVKLDLPTGKTEHVNPLRNSLEIGATGVTEWNGRAVSRAELRSLLAATTRLPTAPELHLRPDPQAPYRVVDEVLVLTKQARVERLGFVGNEAYARF
jgi:biopolymer transport protein ExbD